MRSHLFCSPSESLIQMGESERGPCLAACAVLCACRISPALGSIGIFQAHQQVPARRRHWTQQNWQLVRLAPLGGVYRLCTTPTQASPASCWVVRRSDIEWLVQEILCQPRISQIVELHACRRIKLARFESDVLKFFTALFRFLLLLFCFEC